jgi:hypothetical protein
MLVALRFSIFRLPACYLNSKYYNIQKFNLSLVLYVCGTWYSILREA